MDTKAFFNTHLLFRFSEFMAFAKQQSSITDTTDKNLRMLLYRYCKNNKLTNVRKGLYVVNNERHYQSNLISPLMVAGKATDDAVIAYHTALESHGIAYTDFNEHTYLTAYHTNNFEFQDQNYRAIYQERLTPLDDKTQWIETVLMQGIALRRTTLERTMVDVLNRPDRSGGWEEIIRSLDRVTIFDVSAAINYALSLDRASIIAKLGYFLEQRPAYLKIDPALINKLLPHIPKQPYYMDRKTVGQGSYFKKWQIIVPDHLHQRQWEEPDEMEH